MTLYDTLPAHCTFPREIATGVDLSERLAEQARHFGQRGLLIHGHSMRRRGKISKITANTPPGMELETWEYSGGEPTKEQLTKLVNVIEQIKPDWIAALGGGSIMGLAKAATALHESDGLLPSQQVEGTPIPLIAIPTTAGTGSEATSSAMILDRKSGRKTTLCSPLLSAEKVILDPALLKSLSPEVIAYAGMDALTRAIESYVSNKATWLSRQLALKAIAMLHGNLSALFESNGTDLKASKEMLEGSFLSGLAFSTSGLGVVHGMATPLGTRYHIPHGLVCAACLPYVLNFNRQTIKDDYQILSEIVGQDLLVAVAAMLARLNLDNPFKDAQLVDLDGIAEEILDSASTQCNPRPIDKGEVLALVRELFTH